MFDPFNHRQRCPEHGIAACLTCHRVDGECDLGGCERPAERTAEILERGRVVERRPVCRRDTCETILRQTNAAVRFIEAPFSGS